MSILSVGMSNGHATVGIMSVMQRRIICNMRKAEERLLDVTNKKLIHGTTERVSLSVFNLGLSNLVREGHLFLYVIRG